MENRQNRCWLLQDCYQVYPPRTSSLKPTPRMEETAYHEAGHALMAALQGGRVRYVTIEPDRDDGPRRFGEAQIEWPRQNIQEKKFRQKLLLVALAGPVAEMIYRGEPLHPGFVPEWSDDWQVAWEAAALVIPAEPLRLAFLEEAVRACYGHLHQDHHWQCIASLADELLAHETLEAEQVEEVWEQWLR